MKFIVFSTTNKYTFKITLCFIHHLSFSSFKKQFVRRAISFLVYSLRLSQSTSGFPVWQRKKWICVLREKYSMQRLAERNRADSNLDLFVLWSLPAAEQSVASYRSPALPNFRIYGAPKIIFQGIIMHQISRMYGPNINPELNIEWKRAGRYIGLRTQPDTALLNCKPEQSPNLFRAWKVPDLIGIWWNSARPLISRLTSFAK